MKYVLVIDDTPSKVEHLKSQGDDNRDVTFVETFLDARREMINNPKKYDRIYLDYDLDGKFKGVDLLEFFVFDNVLKPGCRIIPNSLSDKFNSEIKKEIVRLKITRRDTLNKN